MQRIRSPTFRLPVVLITPLSQTFGATGLRATSVSCTTTTDSKKTKNYASIHPRVRRLYLSFMLLAPRYPGMAEATYRGHVKRAFRNNENVEVGSREWKVCLAKGRYELKNIETFIDFHRFRRMKKQYDWGAQ